MGLVYVLLFALPLVESQLKSKHRSTLLAPCPSCSLPPSASTLNRLGDMSCGESSPPLLLLFSSMHCNPHTQNRPSENKCQHQNRACVNSASAALFFPLWLACKRVLMLMEVTINYTMITVMVFVPPPRSLAKEISD